MMASFDIDKLSRNVTIIVTFKLTKRFRFRKWIATQLIILAAKVLGCGIEFINDDKLQPLPS